MDSTKELCSDNRHRILHTLWGIRRICIPIFGHTLFNSSGKEVNVKDLLELDHVLPDYRNRFIPTLLDFVVNFEELSENDYENINHIQSQYKDREDIKELLISPFNITGELKALRITHNVWFCNEIIPKIFGIQSKIEQLYGIRLFESMHFKLWMDNGVDLPPSCKKRRDHL